MARVVVVVVVVTCVLVHNLDRSRLHRGWSLQSTFQLPCMYRTMFARHVLTSLFVGGGLPWHGMMVMRSMDWLELELELGNREVRLVLHPAWLSHAALSQDPP